ncbi:MAG: hypothetical protein R3B98_00890 [Hyphomonas sp.]
MLDYLTRTDGQPWAYLLRAYATVILGTVLIILVASGFVPSPEPVEDDASRAFIIFVLLGLWPVVGTGLIQGLLIPARRFAPTYWHAAAGTALVIAVLLTLLGGPIAGIVYAWPFFVYSVTFLAWQLVSTTHAWVMTVLLQAMVNLLPALLSG